MILPTLMNIACIIFAVLSVIFMLGSFLTYYTRPMLIAASTGFVLVGIIAFLKNKSKYGAFVLLALIFCWFGDFLGSYNFKSSVIAFALAHLAFILSFLFHNIKKSRCLISLVIFSLFDVGIYYWLNPFLNDSDRILVITYMVIITIMVILALGVSSEPIRILVYAGAVLFYISDIFVARWKFVHSSSLNAFFCYPLYYTSCLLFAFSILAYKGRETKMV